MLVDSVSGGDGDDCDDGGLSSPAYPSTTIRDSVMVLDLHQTLFQCHIGREMLSSFRKSPKVPCQAKKSSLSVEKAKVNQKWHVPIEKVSDWQPA